MYADEKRELRLQISQLLADAGLNQGTIKQMVETEIQNKVSRAVEQVLENMNKQTYSGNYIEKRITDLLHDTYINNSAFSSVVREELKNRAIKIVLTDVEGLKDG